MLQAPVLEVGANGASINHRFQVDEYSAFTERREQLGERVSEQFPVRHRENHGIETDQLRPRLEVQALGRALLPSEHRVMKYRLDAELSELVNDVHDLGVSGVRHVWLEREPEDAHPRTLDSHVGA